MSATLCPDLGAEHFLNVTDHTPSNRTPNHKRSCDSYTDSNPGIRWVPCGQRRKPKDHIHWMA